MNTDQLMRLITDYADGTIYATEVRIAIDALVQQRDEAVALLRDAAPIVSAAFYDHHSAGTIPGSGYNHKAEHMAGSKWGWRDATAFNAWHERVKAIVKIDGADAVGAVLRRDPSTETRRRGIR